MLSKVGIIGAGTMGSGIAQKVAQEGIQAVMVDLEERFVQKGMEGIKGTLAEAIRRKIFSPEQAATIMARIKGTTLMAEVGDADLVIEVVFEDMAVKKALFQKLDRLCGPKTVLASNTSSFSITELSSAVARRDRFVGLHFFYHPAKNRLLEVIPGRDTSQKTLELAASFSRLLGKTAISVRDAPGFAVNRFFVPWLNEATRILEDGLANIPTIDDTAKKAFGIGMGPFELMNATGIPIAHHTAVSLGSAMGDYYMPSARLREQFKLGTPWDLGGEVDPSKAGQIEERLLGAVFVVACGLVDEGVASIEDVDRGAKVGLRWALGPFELMNARGMERSSQIAESHLGRHLSLQMPGILKRQREKGKPWEFNLVDLEVRGGIARLVINRPEAMNAINEAVISQLDEGFSKAESDASVRTIVLEGAGKAFVAGADIQYFIKKIDENDLDGIVRFTRKGHELLERIDGSGKLVIAKLDGLALGGGAEIALAADTIVASERGSIGFPETGIGIYPGLGGTQRTPRYIGKELARYLVFTGRTVDARTAMDMGLVEYVVPSAELDGKIAELSKGGSVLTKATRGKPELSDELRRIRDQFSDTNVQKLLSGSAELDDAGKKLAKSISYKAPIAIKMAGDLIDQGLKHDLRQGLKLELEHLKEIFSTQDAYEGLRSVVEKRRPTFKGA